MVLSGLFLLGSVLLWNIGLALVSVFYLVIVMVLDLFPDEKVEAFLDAFVGVK